MSLSLIDRAIGREVGTLCYYSFSEFFPETYVGKAYEEFKEIMALPEPAELMALRKQDPLVEYPVLYLGTDVFAKFTARPFLYPPQFGEHIHLSEYLGVLRRFLILQFTTRTDRHVDIIGYALRSVAEKLSPAQLLEFVDSLWRGRWIIDVYEWAKLRRTVIAMGLKGGDKELEGNLGRLEQEALRIIQLERDLKESVDSMNEWLHAIYCLAPQVCTWALTVQWANEKLHSDELDKYGRALEECLVDIGDTLDQAFWPSGSSQTFADHYALEPLRKSESVEEALRNIRRVYRGRTVIPRIWYEKARMAIGSLPDGRKRVGSADYASLNDVDRVLSLGLNATLYSRWDNMNADFAFGF